MVTGLGFEEDEGVTEQVQAWTCGMDEDHFASAATETFDAYPALAHTQRSSPTEFVGMRLRLGRHQARFTGSMDVPVERVRSPWRNFGSRPPETGTPYYGPTLVPPGPSASAD